MRFTGLFLAPRVFIAGEITEKNEGAIFIDPAQVMLTEGQMKMFCLGYWSAATQDRNSIPAMKWKIQENKAANPEAIHREVVVMFEGAEHEFTIDEFEAWMGDVGNQGPRGLVDTEGAKS